MKKALIPLVLHLRENLWEILFPLRKSLLSAVCNDYLNPDHFLCHRQHPSCLILQSGLRRAWGGAFLTGEAGRKTSLLSPTPQGMGESYLLLVIQFLCILCTCNNPHRVTLYQLYVGV